MAKEIEKKEDVNEEPIIYPLEDDEGNVYNFEALGECEYKDHTYYALAPVDGPEEEGYVIMRVEETGEEDYIDLTPVEDDEEFDAVAEIFDDLFFSDMDFDA